MPIEVKELTIQMVCGDNKEAGGAPLKEASAVADTNADQDTLKKIVSACVDQVLKILARKAER